MANETGAERFRKDWVPEGGRKPCFEIPTFKFAEAYKDDCTQKLAFSLDVALMEIRTIDEVLARRPALADFKDRYAKVEHACTMDGRAEKAESEVRELKAQLERVQNLEDVGVLLQAAECLAQGGGGPMEDRLRLLHDTLVGGAR